METGTAPGLTPAISAFTQRAAQRDAVRDHDGAINELARGVRAGDVPSTRALGLRLLSGNAAPLMPDEGLRFIGDALAAGDAQAAARAAGILALGVNRPPDVPLGLHWLARSAEAGWAPARVHLLALCDDRELARHQAALDRPDWQRLAAAVDVAGWRKPPRGELLSADPVVRRIDALLRPEVCAALIPGALHRLQPARVYDPVGRRDIIDPHRSNTQATFDVAAIELILALVQTRIAVACQVDPRQLEPVAILHYNPGEQIADHYDFVDPDRTPDYAAELQRNGQRIATFLIYLNDDYDGGETEFPRLAIRHRGRCGDALVFVNATAELSPDRRTLHAGRPPTRGEKWIVSQFIRSRALRP